jgi:hypothetical protein
LLRGFDDTIALEPERRDMDSFTGAHVSLLEILWFMRLVRIVRLMPLLMLETAWCLRG